MMVFASDDFAKRPSLTLAGSVFFLLLAMASQAIALPGIRNLKDDFLSPAQLTLYEAQKRRIVELSQAGNITALRKLKVEVTQSWQSRPDTIYELLFDFYSWSEIASVPQIQQAEVKQFADEIYLEVIVQPERLPLDLHTLFLAKHSLPTQLASPAAEQIQIWQKQRAEVLTQWMVLWSRYRQEIDPGFDEKSRRSPLGKPANWQWRQRDLRKFQNSLVIPAIRSQLIRLYSVAPYNLPEIQNALQDNLMTDESGRQLKAQILKSVVEVMQKTLNGVERDPFAVLPDKTA